jgi:hypothetical protein
MKIGDTTMQQHCDPHRNIHSLTRNNSTTGEEFTHSDSTEESISYDGRT